MGFGLGTEEGMMASIFHILSHAATKSLLFIAAIGLTDVSKGSRHFQDLTGAGYRNKIAGVGFTVGALSMVGLPAFSGFVSKILFAQAAVFTGGKTIITLLALSISTILNAIYFMKTVIRIYTPVKTDDDTILAGQQKEYTITILLFIGLNLILGLTSWPITEWILMGLSMFS